MLHFSVYTYVAVGAYMSQRRDQNKYALWMCQVSSYVSFPPRDVCGVYGVCSTKGFRVLSFPFFSMINDRMTDLHFGWIWEDEMRVFREPFS